MKIIGVGGTNGAGKDSLGLLLAEEYGYLNATATDMFVKELNKRGLPIDRAHKSKLSAEWRRDLGMAAIVDKAIALFNENPGKYKGLVVGSLRHPGEAERVHELGGTVVWVDADPRVRYDRIQKSLSERTGTHAEEGVTFEAFLADEKREMTPEGDAATLNMAGVKELSDVTVSNDTNKIEDFKAAAKKALNL
jgi:cytidylate kinase